MIAAEKKGLNKELISKTKNKVLKAKDNKIFKRNLPEIPLLRCLRILQSSHFH